MFKKITGLTPLEYNTGTSTINKLFNELCLFDTIIAFPIVLTYFRGD